MKTVNDNGATERYHREGVERVSVAKRAMLVLIPLAVLIGFVVIQPSDVSPIVRVTSLSQLPNFQTLAVDAPAGRFFVADSNPGGHPGLIRTFDVATGQPQATIALPDAPGTLVIDSRVQHVFASHGVTVSTLDSRTLGVLRAVTVIAGPIAPASIDAASRRTVTIASPLTTMVIDEKLARVFGIASGGAAIDVLDARSGELLWSIPVDGPVVGLALDRHVGHLIVTSDVTSRGGGTGATWVSVIDARNGRLLRTATIPMDTDPSLPIVVDETHAHAFVLTDALTGAPAAGANPNSGSVSIIDTRSGTLIHTVPMGSAIKDVAVDEQTGYAYAATLGTAQYIPNITTTRNGRFVMSVGRPTLVPVSTGFVRVLDATSGKILRTISVGPAPLSVGIDEQRRRIYVLNAGRGYGTARRTDASSVSVIDARNGTVLSTISTGVGDGHLIIDSRAGRVVVLNDGGFVAGEDDKWGWIPSWVRRALPIISPLPDGNRAVPASVTILDMTR